MKAYDSWYSDHPYLLLLPSLSCPENSKCNCLLSWNSICSSITSLLLCNHILKYLKNPCHMLKLKLHQRKKDNLFPKRGMLLLQRSNGVRKTCWCPMWKIELKRLFLLQVCDFLLCLHLLQHCHWALSLNANNVTWEQLLFCATQQFILTENEREKSAYPWFCITLCLILPHHCPMRLDLFFLEKMCCNLINKMSFHIKNIICTTKCNLLYSHLHISHSHEPCLSCFGHFKWRYQAFHTPSQIFLSLEWVRKTIGNISVYTNSGQLWYQSSNSIK